MRQLVGVLGTPIDKLTFEQALAQIELFVSEGRFHQIATANTDFLVNANSDFEFQTVLRRADMVVPDGMPLIPASALLGSALPERITGADLVPRLAERAADLGWRIYMLGALPEVAQKARERLLADFPGIQIVGCPACDSLSEMDEDALLADIQACGPHILLVAFGSPRQEKWIYSNREALAGVAVCIGVGGTFDFLARAAVRAPLWMQRRGLEWLHRLVHNPKRLIRRYARDLVFGFMGLAQQWWRLNRQRRQGCFYLEVTRTRQGLVLSPQGDIDGSGVIEIQGELEIALIAGRDVTIDLQKVTFIGIDFLGYLMHCQSTAKDLGRELRLVNATTRVARVLYCARIETSSDPVYNAVTRAAAA